MEGRKTSYGGKRGEERTGECRKVISRKKTLEQKKKKTKKEIKTSGRQ